MIKKLFVITCALALSITSILAQGKPSSQEPPPKPHLMIPLPPDTELPPPPPDGTPEEFIEAAINAIDTDENGELSFEEIYDAIEATHDHDDHAGQDDHGKQGHQDNKGGFDDDQDDAAVVLDFNMDDEDQEERFIEVSAGDNVEVQIFVKDMPASWGASFAISYDENALAYKGNSFKATKLIPNLIALSTANDGTVEVGGANFTKKLGGGSGVFGTLTFEVANDFSGTVDLIVDNATFRTSDDEVIWDDIDSLAEISIDE